MLSYCLKRIGLALLTLFCVIAITFFAMNAIPGGPFDAEKAPSPEIKQVLMERYNLDKPLPEQFIAYLGNLLKGDFGISIKTGRSITETILTSFRISLNIGIYAIIVALVFGLILGCTAAAFANRWPDRVIISLTSIIVSVPSFVIASILMLVFCLKLRWVSVWSATDPNYVLPVISLAVFPMANIIRYTKSSMLDVMGQNYIRTARAKGLAEWKVIFKHAFRNASIPIITYIGPMIAGVLTGSVVIETVFTIGGLGFQFVNGITNRDYTLIMGTTIFLAAIIILITLLSDLLYKAVDPRIKL
ncbi:MAG: ABC transporter permease [Lachnospiraceae bacterium]|nr:ABC transporter permease [Candidatus Darwinimomas equi]